jgi:hypothetical protein
VKTIQLEHGKVALLDDEDFERLSTINWHAKPPVKDGYAWYARGNTKNRTVWLHREVLLITDPAIHVDHINGNGLDCRKDNLRPGVRRLNMMNRRKVKASNSATGSRFKGVWREPSSGKWRAHIRVNKRLIILGRFSDEEGAARAYDAAAVEYFGQYANCNFKRSA